MSVCRVIFVGIGTWLIVIVLFTGTLGHPIELKRDHGLTLRIVHTNDMHSRFVETSKLSSTCTASDSKARKCYGGFARLATAIRQARNSSTPTLFLNAGDTYQGTVWFNVHKWKIVAKFLNLLSPDAISLGNHEFDNGVKGLIPFIENAAFPVLASNLDLTYEPELRSTKLANSTILEVNGTKIGVIGYLTAETKILSSSGKVIFVDEVESVAKEARLLKAQGINILIALGHSGYEIDKKIAKEVEDIDLVIGGHTNTFLYTGDQPDSEVPEGFYPTEVTKKSGKKAYVVQAYAYTKYLGNFSVNFDANGEITHIEGNPILINGSVEQAPDILDELENWRGAIDNLTYTIVGSTNVLLDGNDKHCRREECNLGNMIVDAMVDHVSKQYAGKEGWTNAAIAVYNGGGIRTSITGDEYSKITVADVLAVLPFGSSLLSVSMNGTTLVSMLEKGVEFLDVNSTTNLHGAFLQLSGLQVVYDLDQAPNSRVVSVQVRCAACRIPSYTELDRNATYNVLMNDFMYSGGDGFNMLSNLDYTVVDAIIADIVIDYLESRSPVYPAVEWRITFENSKNVDNNNNHASYMFYPTMTTILLPLISRLLT